MKVRIYKASDYMFKEEREYNSLDECIPALMKEFSPDPDFPYKVLVRKGTHSDYDITIADDYLD